MKPTHSEAGAMIYVILAVILAMSFALTVCAALFWRYRMTPDGNTPYTFASAMILTCAAGCFNGLFLFGILMKAGLYGSV